MNAPRRTALVSLLVLFTLLGSLLPLPGPAGPVRADHSPAPSSVTIAGS